jgi:ElaB/YqjD/DUF883 family membrane-anchored ribosome-binding protein
LTKNRKWINQLKSALILDKTEKLEQLLNQKIEFSPEEFDEVKHLFKEILKNSLKKQMKLKDNMEKIQNNINFRRTQLKKGKNFNQVF